jgi:murein DD-endopeptidase MepM/ murein hydrolase activator NlpD
MALVAPLPGRPPRRSEFQTVDREGAPDRRGVRHHGAVDWFAPAGTIVRAPETGKVVEVKPSSGTSGQVFGGVIKIQAADGRVWVFRHVDPGTNYRPGQNVGAGQPLARVTRWADSPSRSHAHIELWRTLTGGYRFENMLDPVVYLSATGVGPYPTVPSFTVPSLDVGGALGKIPGADTVGDVWDAATAVPKAFEWAFGNWDRILEVLGGAVLLLLGLYRLAGQLGAPDVAAAIPLARAAKAAA